MSKNTMELPLLAQTKRNLIALTFELHFCNLKHLNYICVTIKKQKQKKKHDNHVTYDNLLTKSSRQRLIIIHDLIKMLQKLNIKLKISYQSIKLHNQM